MASSIEIPLYVSKQQIDLTVKLGPQQLVNSRYALKRAKKIVSSKCGTTPDSVIMRARWSSDGSEHSATDIDEFPHESAQIFTVEHHGYFEAELPEDVIPNLVETISELQRDFKEYVAKTDKRIDDLESEAATAKENEYTLMYLSDKYMSVSRRNIIEHARSQLCRDAGVGMHPWSAALSSVIRLGDGWLEQFGLSTAAVLLTSSTTKEEGNLAAHKVDYACMEMAVKQMEASNPEWRQLFSYICKARAAGQ